MRSRNDAMDAMRLFGRLKYESDEPVQRARSNAEIFELMVEMGVRPRRSEIAAFLDDVLRLIPTRVPENVREAIGRELLGKYPQGKPEVPIRGFLKKNIRAVVAREKLMQQAKADRNLPPNMTVDDVVSDKYHIEPKTLQRLVTLFRKHVSVSVER
jgi:hypothetical protein